MTTKIRTLLLATVAGLALGIAGCASPASPASPPSPAASESPAASSGTIASGGALDRAGLVGLDAVGVIERLDASDAGRPLDFTASVRPHEVLLADDTGQYSLQVPEDRFYVSIAPFREQTHECFHHSLATCRGELAGEQVHLLVTASDGEPLVDRDATLYANGFVGMWLPRNVTGTIRVTQGDRDGEVPFSTTDDSATCLTTLRLV